MASELKYKSVEEKVQNMQSGVIEGTFAEFKTDFEIVFNEPFWENPSVVVATLHLSYPVFASLILFQGTLTNEKIKGRIERENDYTRVAIPNSHYEIHWIAIS